MNRRAAFTPLHRPNYEWHRIIPSAPEHRALKRNKFRAPNPNGIPSQSPGLRGTSYLGSRSRAGHNPNGVAPFVVRPSAATPLGLREILHRVPRVARSSQPWAGCHCPVGASPIHPRGYRSRYAEFLKIDFPRLPLTGNLELFRALARLGGELVALHLLEFEVRSGVSAERRHLSPSESAALCRDAATPKVYPALTEFIGGRSPVMEKVSWSKNTVWLDMAQTTGFKGVREDVWNFHIGGYQVCEKWLKDRKDRNLSADDRAHYQKIVIALSETIRLMSEIDAVIAKHGGWPLK